MEMIDDNAEGLYYTKGTNMQPKQRRIVNFDIIKHSHFGRKFEMIRLR
jgi:hypothetical protein